MMPSRLRVVIRGGGEMGSGVAWHLAQAGCAVVITECAQPRAVRRWVCFSEAVYDGVQTVAGVTARRVDSRAAIDAVLSTSEIAILTAPHRDALADLKPDLIIDATLTKTNVEPIRGLATLTIGLGPGFTAAEDVDCVIETNRGPDIGRCLWSGSAEPDTGVPGMRGGETVKRVLRAPNAGVIQAIRSLGDSVSTGEPVACVTDATVVSELDGILRGLIRPGIEVAAGQKIGDVDPCTSIDCCRRISGKASAIAGGVLKAVCTLWPRIMTGN